MICEGIVSRNVGGEHSIHPRFTWKIFGWYILSPLLFHIFSYIDKIVNICISILYFCIGLRITKFYVDMEALIASPAVPVQDVHQATHYQDVAPTTSEEKQHCNANDAQCLVSGLTDNSLPPKANY